MNQPMKNFLDQLLVSPDGGIQLVVDNAIMHEKKPTMKSKILKSNTRRISCDQCASPRQPARTKSRTLLQQADSPQTDCTRSQVTECQKKQHKHSRWNAVTSGRRNDSSISPVRRTMSGKQLPKQLPPTFPKADSKRSDIRKDSLMSPVRRTISPKNLFQPLPTLVNESEQLTPEECLNQIFEEVMDVLKNVDTPSKAIQTV